MKTIPFAKSLTSCAVAVLFFQSSSWAQQATDGGSLKEVQVINTSPLPGIGIEKFKLPYEVQSVDSQALKNSNTLNIGEFMNENLNGVNVNDIQGSPYQADVTYRGSRASATLGAAQGLSVYMDGVRVNEPFGDVVNWDMLPEAAFENVTLVPGSNPIYGLNTLGGALAFTTKSGLTTQGNEVGLSLGSFGRLKVDLTHGGKSADGWHRFVAATAFDETGWRDYSAGNLQNLFVKLGRTQNDTNWDVSFLNGNSKLKGNGLLPSTNFGADGIASSSPSSGIYELDRSAIYSHVDITKNTTNLLTFNMQHLLDNNTELAATAYLRSGSQKRTGGDVEWEPDNPAFTNPGLAEGLIRHSATSQTSYGVSANLTKILDAHQITAGASLDQSISKYGASEETNCTISTSRGVSDCADAEEDTAGVKGGATSFGVYLADTMKWGEKTYITVAGRFNQTTVNNTITKYTAGVGTELDEEKFTYRSLNPSLGLSHKLNDNLTVFGNWAQSNRAPTVIELGCADKDNPCQLPTGLQSDPYLSQVVARTIEGGMRWKNSSNYNLAVSVYRTENLNDILFSPSTLHGFGFFQNFDKTRYDGIDINASKAWTTVRLNAAYSYLKATYEAEGELFAGDREMNITPGMRLPGIPLHTIKLNMEWQATEKLSLGAGLQYSSSLRTQGNEDGLVADGEKADASIKAHTLLNLKANYQLQKGLSVFGKINNLLDTRYETYGMIGANNFALDGSSTDTQTFAKFVAPGAPRSYMVGLRYQF